MVRVRGRHARLVGALSMVLVGEVAMAAAALAQYPPGTSSQCAQVGDTSVTPNQSVTVSGDVPGTGQCFDDGSLISVFFIQSITRIASTSADANGAYTVAGTIPSTARSGAASIEARGRLNGDPRTYSTAITVARAGGAGLPATGRDIAIMTAWGVALVAAGMFLVRFARRRRARARVAA